MSDPSEIICFHLLECTESANDSKLAPTVPGVAYEEHILILHRTQPLHLILTIYGAMLLTTMACNDPQMLRRSMSSV